MTRSIFCSQMLIRVCQVCQSLCASKICPKHWKFVPAWQIIYQLVQPTSRLSWWPPHWHWSNWESSGQRTSIQTCTLSSIVVWPTFWMMIRTICWSVRKSRRLAWSPTNQPIIQTNCSDLLGQFANCSWSVISQQAKSSIENRILIKKKHRKNCECCPGHYLIVLIPPQCHNSNLNRWLCSNCSQCLLASTSVY